MLSSERRVAQASDVVPELYHIPGLYDRYALKHETNAE